MTEADDVRELVAELVDLVAAEKETLAGRLGVSYASLYAWGTGRRRASPRVLRRMADLADDHVRDLGELAARLRRAAEVAPPAPGGGGRAPAPGRGQPPLQARRFEDMGLGSPLRLHALDPIDARGRLR